MTKSENAPPFLSLVVPAFNEEAVVGIFYERAIPILSALDGDFELIFGASKLNLKVIEIPVRYASRVYGQTQISRFSHGLLLLRMVVFAYRKFKAI